MSCLTTGKLRMDLLGCGGYSNLGTRGKNFQKLMLFNKKKSFDLGFHFLLQNSWCTLKKKVFTSISSLISLLSSQNQGVLQTKKRSLLSFDLRFPYFRPKIRVFSKKKKKKKASPRIVLYICSGLKLYVLFSRGGPKKRGVGCLICLTQYPPLLLGL